MTLRSSECPADLEKVAEGYVMRTLREEQAIAFGDHFASCESCMTILYKMVDCVDAMRAAAKALRAGPLRASSAS